MNKQEIIEYLKDQIEWSGNHNYSLVNRAQLISMIEQLDEPQKVSWRKAISILEQHFQCEIPRNLDNVVKGYREMSGILNTVEFELSKMNSELTAKEFIFKALESKKQKVKVSEFVVEWFEENKYNLNFAIYELCEAGKVPVDLSEGLTDFERWFYLNHDIDTLIRMQDGYEVEKELYIMPVPYVKTPVHYCVDENGEINFRQGNAQKFTNDELNKYFYDISDFAEKV